MSELGSFKLVSQLVRNNASAMAQTAPEGTLVVFKQETRTAEQNRKLWPMLQDISDQVIWHGKKLKKEDWKHIFTAALRGYETTYGLNGETVVLGKETSKMGKREFADLIELIYAFGAEHSVVWSEKALEGFEGVIQ